MLFSTLECNQTGIHFQPDQPRASSRLVPEGSAGLNPFQNRAILGRVTREAASPAVRDCQRWLLKQQALFRMCQIDARDSWPFHFGSKYLVAATFDDPLVVLLRRKSGNGQFEAAAAFHAAVTA